MQKYHLSEYFSLYCFVSRKSLKGCVVLSPLLGLTWVFGLLAVADAGLVFQYIFAILNSAQVCLSMNSPSSIYERRGIVSKETVVLCRWGSETRKFDLSTELTVN